VLLAWRHKKKPFLDYSFNFICVLIPALFDLSGKPRFVEMAFWSGAATTGSGF
jgi:hypothetical protein